MSSVYLFISFNFENDLSAVATVTGSVINSSNAMQTSGTVEDSALFSTSSR